MSYRKVPVNVFWHVIILCRGVSLPPISGAWEIQEVIMPRRKVESKARLGGCLRVWLEKKKSVTLLNFSRAFQCGCTTPRRTRTTSVQHNRWFLFNLPADGARGTSVLPSTCLNTDRAVRGFSPCASHLTFSHTYQTHRIISFAFHCESEWDIFFVMWTTASRYDGYPAQTCNVVVLSDMCLTTN